jgi:hypothetical protein
MTTRLDTQRAPAKLHGRKNDRLYQRGYEYIPQPVWGDRLSGQPIPPPATGANAGIPGAWTPSGATPPTSPVTLAQGIPSTVTASPATAWTTGQYVQTQTAGAAGRACWTGTSWVSGAAP